MLSHSLCTSQTPFVVGVIIIICYFSSINSHCFPIITCKPFLLSYSQFFVVVICNHVDVIGLFCQFVTVMSFTNLSIKVASFVMMTMMMIIIFIIIIISDF